MYVHIWHLYQNNHSHKICPIDYIHQNHLIYDCHAYHKRIIWPTLEERRKNARLTLLYKISNQDVKTFAGDKLIQRAHQTVTG